MSQAVPLDRGQLIMIAAGVLLAGAGLFVFSRPVASEGGVYARRIAGTMLTMLGTALVLFSLAYAVARSG